MGRPKSKDATERVTICVPASLLRLCEYAADAKFLSMSAFITSLIRKRFKNAEGA